jgi:hypothetical protein
LEAVVVDRKSLAAAEEVVVGGEQHR